jgi:hypothetical protein
MYMRYIWDVSEFYVQTWVLYLRCFTMYRQIMQNQKKKFKSETLFPSISDKEHLNCLETAGWAFGLLLATRLIIVSRSFQIMD